MNTKNLLLAILLLFYGNSFSQTIRDSVFTNVNTLDYHNMVQSGNQYLIDTPIEVENGKIPIIYNDTRLPNKIFFYSFPQFSEFILISADWDYYRSVAESCPKGYCCEPIPSNIYYKIKRKNTNNLKIDSIKIQGDENPKIVFNENKSKEGFIKVYFEDYFGSVCCPRDLRWNRKPTMDDYIKYFEKTQKVKISGTFVKSMGEEGEHYKYYTLEGLSLEQKLEFLQGRKRYFSPKDKSRIKLTDPKLIYTPIWIKNENLQLEK